MADEILEAEMREQLIAQGVDAFSLDFILAEMRDSGVFDTGQEGGE